MSNQLETPDKQRRKSCWSNLVRHYEKRNASLERRHDALAERVRMMELALPSVLMGVVVNLNPLTDDNSTKNGESYCGKQSQSSSDDDSWLPKKKLQAS